MNPHTIIISWRKAAMGILHARPEENLLPSETRPDQVLSLRTLIDRYTRGLDVPLFQPVYNDDDDLPNFEQMDSIDKAAMAMDIREGITKFQQTHRNRKPEQQSASPSTPSRSEPEDVQITD